MLYFHLHFNYLSNGSSPTIPGNESENIDTDYKAWYTKDM